MGGCAFMCVCVDGWVCTVTLSNWCVCVCVGGGGGGELNMHAFGYV